MIKKIHFTENHVFGNPGKQPRIHLMNFYSSQLSKHREPLPTAQPKGKAAGPAPPSPAHYRRVMAAMWALRWPRRCHRVPPLPFCTALHAEEDGGSHACGMSRPAQSLPLAAVTSGPRYPVTPRLSLCSSLLVMDTFPSQSQMPGSRKANR